MSQMDGLESSSEKNLRDSHSSGSIDLTLLCLDIYGRRFRWQYFYDR